MKTMTRFENQSTSTRVVGGLLLVLLGYMAVETVRAQRKTPFWESARKISEDPWGAFTFKDFYANILLISLWTLSREKKRSVALSWIASYAALGSLGTIPYVLKQLLELPAGSPATDILKARSA